MIEEEQKDYQGENRVTANEDDTFYPENLRSAKNRISRLLKQKKSNDAAAVKKAMASSSIESGDIMAKTTGLPIKTGIFNMSPARSAKRRYRESSEKSSESFYRV